MHKEKSSNDITFGFLGAVNLDSYSEVQHAVLQHKVVGALDVLALLQEGVVDAGVGEAARQVGACQRLHGHLGHGHGVAQLLHVLGEEVGVAHVEGRHRGVECCHGDGGDLGADYGGGRMGWLECFSCPLMFNLGLSLINFCLNCVNKLYI